jgi:isochorismate hydrolase
MTPEVCRVLGGRYGAMFDAENPVDPEGTDNVILVGIESHVCVYQSALEARYGKGNPPIVIADGVSSCNKEEIGLSLNRMRAAGVDVGSSESVLFQLMGDASNDKFKEFQKLIKAELPTTKASLQTLFPTAADAKL